jgi:hypothetical protein
LLRRFFRDQASALTVCRLSPTKVKDEKTIMFDKIESITIKPNGDIVVKSTEHNFIYKDATITIPAQVEDYETVKNLIQKKYAFLG